MVLKQILLYPPPSILYSLRQDFVQWEKDISVQLSEFVQIGKEEGWIRKDNTEQITPLFFTLIDGLLVEQSLYDCDKYENRRDQVWNEFRRIISK